MMKPYGSGTKRFEDEDDSRKARRYTAGPREVAGSCRLERVWKKRARRIGKREIIAMLA